MPRNSVGGKGSYSAICDVCGLKYKAADLRKRWDGAMVCEDDWEPRHPQEFVRAVKDTHILPFVRPDSDGADVSPTFTCSGLEVETMAVNMLNTILSNSADTTASPTPEYTIYKIRTTGGTVHIPNGLTVHVKCSLEIGI